MPGLTFDQACIPKFMGLLDLEYSDLIDRLIQLAMERSEAKKKNRYRQELTRVLRRSA